MCICLCTSLFLSFALRPCAHPHPKPFTSLSNAAPDGHHHCQEEPKVLSTSIWALKLELCALPHAAVWPIPDSPMTQQNTSCGCHCSRRRSNTSAALEADTCQAAQWNLLSKDSSFWFLVCSAFLATHHPNCSACLVQLCQFYFFPLAAEKEQCMNP